MSVGLSEIFSSIRTEGALLPPDILHRIGAGDDLPGLAASDYHLSGERIADAINRAWNRLTGAWGAFKSVTASLSESDAGTTATREKWLLPLFQELGYGRLTLSKAVESEAKSYPVSHRWQNVPIHLVSFRFDLDKRVAGAVGASKASPHSLVQELLNRSDESLWGFVSNGFRLRILRDNRSLTRQAFVEFDLAAMMDGQAFADFRLLWLICHQSRVEAEKPTDCWLEQWSQTAAKQGTRALDELRDGVQLAIEALGRGFISHPANNALRDRLRLGTLDKQDYYRQLLRIVYRLIFLFVAEDRGLLFAPDSDPVARERYTRHYSLQRLRNLSAKLRGSQHTDQYVGLDLVFQQLGRDDGCPQLALPGLGSFLFSNAAVSELKDCQIANGHLFAAIRALAFTVDDNVRRPIDYKNLGSEEFGSIYESLLELHPDLNTAAGTFELKTAAGHERKTTGSYYTPTSLVNCLLDSALDPVLDEAAKKPNAEKAILGLKACDTACGSGHFLIAAAHRIAKKLAAVRTGDEEPAPAAYRHALRDVISHCIYGVDLNPMAVELCKVSLWMEAIEPGKPLSFLDHRIQVGNSLLGATPALLSRGIPDAAFEPIEGDDKTYCREFKKQNKDERKGQGLLFSGELAPWLQLGNFAASVISRLDALPDDAVGDIRTREQQYAELIHSSTYESGRLLADAWCAALVWKKTKEFDYPITEKVFRDIERNPHSIPPWLKREIIRLREQFQFFHWHLAFPDVFTPVAKPIEDDVIGWTGGFSVVLGNPPWDRVQSEADVFFIGRIPRLAQLTDQQRKLAIQEILTGDSAESIDWKHRARSEAGVDNLLRASNRFPLTGKGKFNTYALFAELNDQLIGDRGWVGCIVQSDVAVASSCSTFFEHLMTGHRLVSFHDFVNTEALFPAIHRTHPHFCLLTLSGRAAESSPLFSFWNTNARHLTDLSRHFRLSVNDIRALNPNEFTCPIFHSQREALLAKEIHTRTPPFVHEGTGANPWQVTLSRMFNMSDDVELFVEATQLSHSMHHDGLLPLYEAKMIHHFDHRWSNSVDDSEPNRVNPASYVLPRYWVTVGEVSRKLTAVWQRQWLLGWREITNTTNERTVIATVLPYAGVGHTCHLIYPASGDAPQVTWLVANLASFPIDFASRLKVGGTHLTHGYLQQLPVLPPEQYKSRTGFSGSRTVGEWIQSRVLELIYTAWDLEPFARDCGYDGPPFVWDDERRFQIRCELDAAYFHLYEIARDDVDYIMETFPIVKRKDVEKHGTYRTKNQILQIYDQMAGTIVVHSERVWTVIFILVRTWDQKGLKVGRPALKRGLILMLNDEMRGRLWGAPSTVSTRHVTEPNDQQLAGLDYFIAEGHKRKWLDVIQTEFQQTIGKGVQFPNDLNVALEDITRVAETMIVIERLARDEIGLPDGMNRVELTAESIP
ncbi:MAG TPA: N-6 DNA methylase [Tepidisphaeraceae bacterium]|nr:N-6 DNA methylase [Tepidisphaeraceae bacterium]